MKTFTLAEVARLLNLSTPTVRKLNLPTVKIGQRVRYLETGLLELTSGRGPEERSAP